MTQWTVKGRQLVNCNCAHGCPCQFNALPTHGDCRAVIGYEIEEGRHGDVRLDGLRAALIVSWPGPVHQGNGSMQIVIDDRADARQRQSLQRIIEGQDTAEMATMWWVYSAMCPTKHPPVFAPIELAIDVDGRTGRLSIDGLVEMAARPIRNPVTGAEHRARIELPHGFEYRVGEIGNASATVGGAIPMVLKDSHGMLAALHLSDCGIPS
jgi:hypothetical protein